MTFNSTITAIFYKAQRLPLVFAALFFALFVSHAQADNASLAKEEKNGLTIILTDVPATTPKDAIIYVAGSFNGWQPGAQAYRLAAQGQGRYAITLPASVRGQVKFKFTLGSWDTVETQASGGKVANREFDIPASGAASYTDTVQAWHFVALTIVELKKELEKILADTHTPGMSLAIVRKDGVEWAAGLGKADVATNRASTADILFRIGSTSKNFTALAILQLVNQGKLSMQDPVRQLVPEVWFDNRWEDTDPVRVVDLLEHTTGWDDMHFSEYAKDAPNISLRDALDFSHQSRISRWKPGTRMSYCNSGPAVAAMIVEKITGQRFEDYVQQHFFAPIGMKTATYFQPGAERATTLYHADGKTPYPYWNILFRPAGSINASANDMASYLAFFLHRGEVNGVPVLPATALDRIEAPSRNWAAQAGLKAGYGLYNYTSINDGLVFHGHNGGVEGGLTTLAYLPEHGVGFFFSINTGNGEASRNIRNAIRAYIARGLTKPVLPAIAALPNDTETHVGWYEPASPRNENMHFFDRLFGLTRFSFDNGKLISKAITQQETTFVAVSGNLFRLMADPIATVALITPNSEGVFIEAGTTMKRIPTWQAYGEIALVAWLALASALIILYSPCWIIAGLIRKWRRPQELWIKVWPFIAVLSLVAVPGLFHLARENLIAHLGHLTLYSAAINVATLVFAMASIAGALSLWRARQNGIGRYVVAFSVFVTIPLLIATAYLTYWGVVGIRLWA